MFLNYDMTLHMQSRKIATLNPKVMEFGNDLQEFQGETKLEIYKRRAREGERERERVRKEVKRSLVETIKTA